MGIQKGAKKMTARAGTATRNEASPIAPKAPSGGSFDGGPTRSDNASADQGRVRRRSGGDRPPAGGGAVYGLGMIGALAYFMSGAESPREYAIAFGKAVVWPVLLVNLAFKRLDGQSEGR
jgi:hypothetical protein